MIPSVCFVLLVIMIFLKGIRGFSDHRYVDVLDSLFYITLATGFFYGSVSGKSSLWTIAEAEKGIRIERDGTVLFDGPIDDLQIIDEERGVMSLRSCHGSAFLFPRRRIFHEFLSQIPEKQIATTEKADSLSGDKRPV